MSDIKRLPFNADAAEEYFSMMLTCYRDTANDIFRRDNEGRHVSEQHYSAEYQKYLGMQIALREVLEYFGKYELGDRWISVEESLPDKEGFYLTHRKDDGWPHIEVIWYGSGCLWNYIWTHEVTHWMPLPAPLEGDADNGP